MAALFSKKSAECAAFAHVWINIRISLKYICGFYVVPERVMHGHKGEPRNNGYYMRREYNIDLLNEIFPLVNMTLLQGFYGPYHQAMVAQISKTTTKH